MSVAFQFLDILVVAIVLASAVYATYRGFVSESLSVFAWIAAAFATLYFGPWAAYWMRGTISPAWLGEVVGYAVVFLVVLLPLAFASARIAENVKRSQVGTLDSAFGTGFGLLRGFAIVGIAYLIFTAAVPIGHQPDWVTKARLMPVIRVSAEAVASLIPDQSVHHEAETPSKPVEQPVEKPIEKSADAPADKPAAVPEKPKAAAVPAVKHKPAKHSKKTYGAKDRHALDRLIETTDSDTSGKP
jgi:membrane protein required for colicin V production